MLQGGFDLVVPGGRDLVLFQPFAGSEPEETIPVKEDIEHAFDLDLDGLKG